MRFFGQSLNGSCLSPISILAINEVKFLQSEWQISNLNLNIWKSDTALLELNIKYSPNVTIEDSTFGNWMFEKISNIIVRNCSQGSPNYAARVALKFLASVVLLQNIQIQQVGPGNNSLITIRNSNVTIIGSTFRENEARIVSVVNGSSVVVENSTFEGNSKIVDGGSLLVDNSSITVMDTIFHNNSAVEGTIHARNEGHATIDSCIFDHNKNGAIVLRTYSSANISNSRFYNNYSPMSGGAVKAASFCSVNILNTVFSGNVADGAGGAISIYASSNSIISQVNFTQNEAKIWGSAFFVGESSFAFSQTCRFVGNKAGNGESGAAAMAIAWDSSFNLSEGMFLQNTGVESSCIWSFARCRMLIDNCMFEENTPTAVLTQENTVTNITNSKFFNNSSPVEGGAIFCQENCIIQVVRSIFHQNKAIEFGGGAISIHYYSILTISSSVFVENEGKYFGAAIYVSEFSTLSCENCSFKENIARDETYAGGTIRLEFASLLNLSTTTFLGNKGKSTSCVSSHLSQLFVTNSTFDSNTGRVFEMVENNYLEISGSILRNNTTPLLGGAIFSSLNSTILINNATFDKNMALNGGAIFIFNSRMMIVNSNFILNTAQTGGGIRMETNTAVELDHCLFFENRAALNGGGLLVNDHSSLNITESEFKMNFAGHSGSAIYVQNSSQVSSESSLFEENIGVALEVFCSSALHMLNDVMLGNKANEEINFKPAKESVIHMIFCSLDNITTIKYGNNSKSALFDVNYDYKPKSSAISIWVYCTGEVTNVTFENNTADLHVAENGGIFAASTFTTVHIQNATFTKNIGTSFSTSNRCTVFMENSTFMFNTGTALDFSKSAVVIEESRFLNNRSPFRASALSLSGSTMNITYTTFSKNTGGREGAVFIYHSTATFDHCSFANNSAPRNGGGIWATESFINTFNTNATFNYAKSGGFIAIVSTVLSMSGCWIGRNTAEGFGGGLDAFKGNLVQIINSFF